MVCPSPHIGDSESESFVNKSLSRPLAPYQNDAWKKVIDEITIAARLTYENWFLNSGSWVPFLQMMHSDATQIRNEPAYPQIIPITIKCYMPLHSNALSEI